MSCKVYISGKISGVSFAKAYDKFLDAEKRLKSEGYDVVNPMTIKFPDEFGWADCILYDLKELQRCDAIYLLKDWEDSNGAKIEKSFADGIGLKIMYEEKPLSVVMTKEEVDIFAKKWKRAKDAYAEYLAAPVLESFGLREGYRTLVREMFLDTVDFDVVETLYAGAEAMDNNKKIDNGNIQGNA
ncbi:MAG: DUF4406 domain-containing protein [Prevotellaceae bacterium]|nr:DUF4406 domain-containing protein [Prevotellaceae bacterium]